MCSILLNTLFTVYTSIYRPKHANIYPRRRVKTFATFNKMFLALLGFSMKMHSDVYKFVINNKPSTGFVYNFVLLLFLFVCLLLNSPCNFGTCTIVFFSRFLHFNFKLAYKVLKLSKQNEFELLGN